MAPEIDGKLYLTDIESPDGQIASAGDVVQVEIEKTDAYDLIGHVVGIRTKNPTLSAKNGERMGHPEKLTRIATGAPLRVLG